MGSSEGIPSIALLAHRAFALPTKLSLSQTTSFLSFSLPILSPIPPRGASGRLDGAELPNRVNPQQFCEQ